MQMESSNAPVVTLYREWMVRRVKGNWWTKRTPLGL